MDRMIIAICDDDRSWCSEAKRVLEEYAGRNKMDMEIICFECGAQLLAYTGKAPDVLFLDILLRGQGGIEIAKSVNGMWNECQVVYLTDYLFYATEVYHTEHVFYVLKEQFERKIEEIFQKIYHQLQQKEKKLVFSVIGGSQLVLAPREIIYFERIRRVTVIETVHGRYEIWDRLDELAGCLPEIDFVRCHNSYIVYMPAVREVIKGAFIMGSGMRVEISRSYMKSAKEAFMRWALTQTS